MNTLSKTRNRWANPLLLIGASLALGFATLPAAAEFTCDIKIHNKSGVELKVDLKGTTKKGSLIEEVSMTLADGESRPFTMDDIYEVVQIDVLENGRSLGGANFFDEAISNCVLDDYSNQPICKNRPGPGEITLILPGVNCP